MLKLKNVLALISNIKTKFFYRQKFKTIDRYLYFICFVFKTNIPNKLGLEKYCILPKCPTKKIKEGFY